MNVALVLNMTELYYSFDHNKHDVYDKESKNVLISNRTLLCTRAVTECPESRACSTACCPGLEMLLLLLLNCNRWGAILYTKQMSYPSDQWLQE